jgi:hypothetical protein
MIVCVCMCGCSNLGPDRPDVPVRVTFQVTRPQPSTPTQYFVDIHGNTQGVNHDAGPRLASNSSRLVFVCPTCVPTVPHKEITCVMPVGFGGQLEWTVTVFGRVSDPFRWEWVGW